MSLNNQKIQLAYSADENMLNERLPNPLTPEGCDLINFPYFSFDAAKFRNSDFALTVDPVAGFRAVMLWSAAWHQIPAASLPDNDKILFRLSGCMSMDEWLSVKEEAMYGFVKCNDDRWYHKHLSEHANKAWGKSRKAKASVAARKDRQPKHNPIEENTKEKQSFNEDSTNVDTNVDTNVLLGEERRGEEIKDNPLTPLPPHEANTAEPDTGLREEEKSIKRDKNGMAHVSLDSINIECLHMPLPLQKHWLGDERVKQVFVEVLGEYGIQPNEIIWKFSIDRFASYWIEKAIRKTNWLEAFRSWVLQDANQNSARWKREQLSEKASAAESWQLDDETMAEAQRLYEQRAATMSGNQL